TPTQQGQHPTGDPYAPGTPMRDTPSTRAPSLSPPGALRYPAAGNLRSEERGAQRNAALRGTQGSPSGNEHPNRTSRRSTPLSGLTTSWASTWACLLAGARRVRLLAGAHRV